MLQKNNLVDDPTAQQEVVNKACAITRFLTSSIKKTCAQICLVEDPCQHFNMNIILYMLTRISFGV